MDEIKSTLIDLQEQLRNVIKINNRRKALLRRVCEKHFGYQEYKQILHTVNKNIEHNYKTRYVNNSILILETTIKIEKFFVKK